MYVRVFVDVYLDLGRAFGKKVDHICLGDPDNRFPTEIIYLGRRSFDKKKPKSRLETRFLIVTDIFQL